MTDLFASLLDNALKKENLFALSLFPYLAFLWFITKSKLMPRVALFGFYGTLVFVGVTIPVGIYAEKTYGTSLANVDFLHGGAEVFLTLANILVAVGFKIAIDRFKEQQSDQPESPQN
ncbi:hypothetical protein Pse7367_0207 [Thalassoporum mexicanum PCC 7367]|uniref:DUF3593 domain-containing protein n=1 Tax=Thalassoporum mexicanum TaxID=3457544 RepID=UPI00029F9D4F|nr:DUF3593 domain-containing protein [Pseudanabaena sp. PCC 7367]AFY68524.1 hypothetical protein Pse7367_0207 [Pseudanabaena sp. PCC 7367]